MMEDPEIKMDIETPYEKLKDHEKKQLSKNNEAKTNKEKVKSLNLKAKVTKEQTSDDSDSLRGSDEDENEDEAEAFNLMAAKMVLRIKAAEAQDKSTNVIIVGKKVILLVSVQSPRKTRLLSEELGAIAKTGMNLK
ncbi:hypothetical protein Tco_0179663 [Tanacetum coccineum]